jgi:glyoxylase-like metal-dependent hydrolase (beta-lactamase superfamily II)
MTDMEFPEPDADVSATAPADLKRRIDSGDRIAVLDTRAPSEFETWQIEGENVVVENVPYYEFFEGVDEDLLGRVPDPGEDPLYVACAKGESSAYVAGVLADEAGIEATNLADGMNGWARLYEYAELETDADAVVAQYRRPSSGCLAYLVVSDGEAAVVDPLRAFTGEYLADARTLGADLVYALDTHVHADHVSGVRDLVEAGVEGVLPEAAVARGVTYADAVTTVADGDVLQVGDVEVEVLHTPGHTTGMTAYLIDGSVLATGDGLFVESVARPDLEEGDEGAPDAAATLYRSLQDRVLSLPDETVVAPAHFSDSAVPRDDGTYAATIGELAARMDALSMDRDSFVEYVLSDMPPRPANYEEIIAANLGQADVSDAEAFELELGPNNCAASRDAMTSD